VTLYDAFISYSHAKDKPVAAALQSAVQKLGKPWYQRRALRVFRDDTGLAVTPHLWGTIEQALGQSRFLMVLASPQAAASQWVNKEIAYWLDAKSVDTLLIAVTEGSLTWDNAANDFAWDDATPLPPALKGRFVAEPKWVDLTAYREGADKGDARFTELAADFAAAIRGVPKDDLLSAEVLQQRRALRLAGSAAVLLLVLALGATTAGILAYRAQQEAVAQRNRAEQTLAAATKTANSLVFDLAQRFRYAVGVSAALVKDILDRALTLQNQLAASGQATPALRRAEAAALSESVNVLLVIGDTPGALTAAQRAREIIEALLQTDPSNTGWRSDLSVSLNDLGLAQMTAGNRAEALAAYQKGLAIAQQLADSDERNAEWQSNLAVSLERIGDVLAAAGDREDALVSYQKGLDIRQKLADRDKGNTGRQRELGVGFEKVGDALTAAGQREEALVAYQKSLAIAQQVTDSDKGDAGWQRDLGVGFLKIGDMLAAAGQREEALAAYQKGFAIFRQLADSDKGNVGWQRDSSVSLEKIGNVLIAAGQRVEALAAYQKSLAIAQQLADSDKGNAVLQRDLSVSLERVGDVLRDAGQREEALAAYEKSLAIRQKLSESDEGNTDWQDDLSIGLDRIGDARMAAGQREEALAAYRQAFAIRQRLADSDKGNTGWQHGVSVSFDKIGNVLWAEGRREEAIVSYRESLAIRQRLTDSDKGNTAWKRDLAFTFDEIGDALRAQDSLDAAFAAYQKSLSIGRELAEIDNGNAQWRNDLQFVIRRIGGMAYSFVLARDFDKGLAAADQAIALAPDQTWLYTNRAHALMFLDRIDEARTLYLRYRGAQNVEGEKSWQTVILGDFAELRQASLAHPLMDEIEAKFAAGG
jgi:tetratricopeptide (TPR) repeat protein